MVNINNVQPQKKALTIRVLHCVVGMNYGGYETFIMNVYRSIDKSLIQFDFLVSLDGVFDSEIKSMGGQIFKIPFITKSGPFIYERNLNKFFVSHPEYKIVHSHMDKFSGLVMRVAAKNKVPVRIAHSHNTKNEGGFIFNAVKNNYGKMVKFRTHAFACSREAGEWMFKPDNFIIVKNGIEISQYFPDEEIRTQQRKKLGLENSFVLGHVGRFSQQKNHRLLIDIFAAYKKIDASCKLMLVGTGELEAAIKEKAQQQGLLNDIIFYGTSNEIPKLMQAMDVFVFPSLHEGLGIVLIEAQCANLPCVCSDKVPSEADITGTVTFLPLETKTEQWAVKIKAAANRKPEFLKEKLLNTDYNIKITANFLLDFYLSSIK